MYEFSKNFADGMVIIRNYWAPNTEIMVCERSSISVEGLLPFSEEDCAKLISFNWEAIVSTEQVSIAYFHKLDYADY